MKVLKKHYKDILLVAVYTIIAINVYTVWFHTMWHKAYIEIPTSLLILAVGITIGIFYIRSLDKEETKKEEKKALEAENPKEETKSE